MLILRHFTLIWEFVISFCELLTKHLNLVLSCKVDAFVVNESPQSLYFDHQIFDFDVFDTILHINDFNLLQSDQISELDNFLP